MCGIAGIFGDLGPDREGLIGRMLGTMPGEDRMTPEFSNTALQFWGTVAWRSWIGLALGTSQCGLMTAPQSHSMVLFTTLWSFAPSWTSAAMHFSLGAIQKLFCAAIKSGVSMAL